MKLSDIVKRVNKLVGRGRAKLDDIIEYMDDCIDTINAELYTSLPLFTEVYANTITYNEAEMEMIENQDPENPVFDTNSDQNPYTRIPDAYIRGYVSHEVAFRYLRDQDEDQDVYNPKLYEANKWLNKLLAEAGDFKLEDTESIAFNGDVDELSGTSAEDDTGIGYYNPYAE